MDKKEKTGSGARSWLSTPTGQTAVFTLGVVALAFVVFAPSIGHDFCSVDDAYFVRENPVVQGGLSWAGVKAAWTSVHASYWAPLLWMSFMLDQELSGGAPWSFHLTNVILFASSAGLLFLLVRRWTGRSGVAFATALLWALHPARVESVAWITERKDVLSGLFFFAGLWFYTAGRQSGGIADRNVGRASAPGGIAPAAAGRLPGRGRPGSSDPPSTINHQPSTIHCPLGHWILDIGHWILRFRLPGRGLAEPQARRPGSIDHPPSTINHQPSTIHHPPSPIHPVRPLGHWILDIGHWILRFRLPGRGLTEPQARRPGSIDHPPSTINHQPSTIHHQPSTNLLLLAWLCMLLGGMAKQIVIVMPVALTLLDVWPLERTNWDRFCKDVWKLSAEKWAFWLLSTGFVFLAVWTQAAEKSIVEVTWGHRLAMIPIHYLFYLQKMVWPTALAPLQSGLPFVRWQVGLGLAVLVGVTVLLWRLRTKAPWGLWGWLWFVGLLFPLSGVVWAGSERVAVRWLYLPQIGLTLAVVLAVAALGRALGGGGQGGRALCAGVLLFSSGATLRTLNNWRDPNTFGLWIWECHPEQANACAMGGDALMALGEWARALEAFERGVALGDKACFLRQAMVWNHLGHAERTAAAWEEFERVLGRPLDQFAAWERPQERELLWRVRGQALRARGDYAGAIAALKEAVRWEPDSGALVVAEYLRACHEGGRPEEAADAAERLAKATGIRVREWKDLFPCYVEMWKMGARGYAYVYFADYAARFPEDAVNLNYMAWQLATAVPDRLDHARQQEWPQAAVRWAEHALESDKEPPAGVWQVLAAARANAGDSTGAVQAAQKARDLAREQKDEALTETIEKQILSYRMGLAWRE